MNRINFLLKSDFFFRTVFGVEYEVSAHTYLNSHKAEEVQNHWVIVTAAPGKPIVMIPSSEKETVEETQDNIIEPPKEIISQETDIPCNTIN